MTVEANPETVDDALAAALGVRGVRVSLGAQSFGHAQLAVLERRATPESVRAAARRLRAAGVSNLSLDLLFGVPGMGRAELDRDLSEALALDPEHLSCYELEAKPGTRFTHRHGAELARQAELLEDHYEHVIARLGEAGYQIVCDGETVDLDKIQYLLSPQDLAAFDLVPRLVKLGVASLKIEGDSRPPNTSRTSLATTDARFDAALTGVRVTSGRTKFKRWRCHSPRVQPRFP